MHNHHTLLHHRPLLPSLIRSTSGQAACPTAERLIVNDEVVPSYPTLDTLKERRRGTATSKKINHESTSLLVMELPQVERRYRFSWISGTNHHSRHTFTGLY